MQAEKRKIRLLASFAAAAIGAACVAGALAAPQAAFAAEGAAPPARAAAPSAYGRAAVAAADRAAAVCEGLGILRGDGDGVDQAYLSKTSNRMQAIYLTLRLTGREAAAENYSGYASFADAGLVADSGARRLLAYAKANPQYGWQGDQNGNIDPYGTLTAQAMYKVLLTVLGYEMGADYQWQDAIQFAGGLGMVAAARKAYLTNGDLAMMMAGALKTRRKGSEDTLAERLAAMGVIDYAAARRLAVLPGSLGYEPLLSYADGGPLLVEVTSSVPDKKITIRFNAQVNPTYAKAIKNYRYYIPGVGYMPLPARCATAMPDESTVSIQFPSDGWAAYEDSVEKDAFASFIATEGRNEIRVSGLQDVDGNALGELTVDVPGGGVAGGASNAAPGAASASAASGAS
jgi:hypothetical protein